MYLKTLFSLIHFTISKPVSDFTSSCFLDNILLCHLAVGCAVTVSGAAGLNIAFNLRKVLLRIRPGFMSFISACYTTT